jgi:regulatory protein
LKITKIVQQKKNKKRFSIYVDDEYRIGISDELLVKHDLKVDDMITQETIDTILVQEEKSNIKNRMLRLIRHRIRSYHEIEQRFLRDGYDHKLVAEALEDLADEKILDNDQLIKAFINDNTNINPHGNRHILFELRKKGIPEKEIMQMLSQRDEKNVALDYFYKKLKALRLQDPKDRRKAINRLLSRGFTSSIVYDLIKELSGDEHDQ